VFVPGRPFRPSLMFVNEAGTYPSGGPFSGVVLLSHRVGSWPSQLIDRADKHSCLLRMFVNYGCKKFYNIGPRLQIDCLSSFCVRNDGGCHCLFNEIHA